MNHRTFLNAAFCAAILTLAACAGTVTPQRVASGGASYDGDVRNSGVVERASASESSGWVVTARARERYNALVARYGASLWTPAIGQDYGVAPLADGRYLMTDEAMSKFIAMAEKARMAGE